MDKNHIFAGELKKKARYLKSFPAGEADSPQGRLSSAAAKVDEIRGWVSTSSVTATPCHLPLKGKAYKLPNGIFSAAVMARTIAAVPSHFSATSETYSFGRKFADGECARGVIAAPQNGVGSLP